MKKDINQLIENVRQLVASHKLADGAYARWIMEDGTDRKMGVNEYGCADAANLLYTIGDFPKDPDERLCWIRTMQDMQDPETGLFIEGTHHTIHTTAHCIAALELFDALPKYPLKAFEPYKTKEGLETFLDGLEWENVPWSTSHKGAGLYAALNNAEEATPEWNAWYFSWLWKEACPETGLWRKGCVVNGARPAFEHMAGSFHYLFNHEHAKMPLHYPEKMIDTCLAMWKEKQLPEYFTHGVNFIQLDWVYCITRALRQCNHRYEECVQAVTEFAEEYLDFLLSLDPDTSAELDDLHMLFGAISCVAELQSFLPGCLISDKPLKIVLNRRPFV